MAQPTFTYTADPQNSPLDAVRLTVGDTNAADPLLYDGEIAYFLGKSNQGIAAASYLACGAIIAKLSRLCDERVGDVSLSLSQKLKGYTELQATIQNDLGQGASFYCGGMSRTQVRQNAANPDRTAPQVPAEETGPWVQRRDRYAWPYRY